MVTLLYSCDACGCDAFKVATVQAVKEMLCKLCESEWVGSDTREATRPQKTYPRRLSSLSSASTISPKPGPNND